jgi:hypothetical protein
MSMLQGLGVLFDNIRGIESGLSYFTTTYSRSIFYSFLFSSCLVWNGRGRATIKVP